VIARVIERQAIHRQQESHARIGGAQRSHLHITDAFVFVRADHRQLLHVDLFLRQFIRHLFGRDAAEARQLGDEGDNRVWKCFFDLARNLFGLPGFADGVANGGL
jgi:hypothetical protein